MFSASVMYFVCLSYVGKGCLITTVFIPLHDPIDTWLDAYENLYFVDHSSLSKFINVIRLSYVFEISPREIATITVRGDSRTLRASSFLLFSVVLRAESIYQTMKSTYGMNNCHLLQTNSRVPGSEADLLEAQNLPDPWSKFLPPVKRTVDFLGSHVYNW